MGNGVTDSERRRKTKISGGTVIAYKDGSHRVLENGVVVFEGDRIIHVGDTI